MGRNVYTGKFVLVLLTGVRNGNQPASPAPGYGLIFTPWAALPVGSEVDLPELKVLNKPRLLNNTHVQARSDYKANVPVVIKITQSKGQKMKRKLRSMPSSLLANRFWLGLLSEVSSACTSTYWGAFGCVWAHTDHLTFQRGLHRRRAKKLALKNSWHRSAM